MQKEISLIDAAVSVLEIEKKPFDLYQLFDVVTAEQKLSDEVKADILTKFYTDLTTSAKFVYVGDNKWDLKANQKIELWEKDGSFYKEYTVVVLPEDYKETPKAVAKPAKKQAKKAPVVIEDVAEPVVEPVVEEVIEEVVAKPAAKEKDLFAETPETKDPAVVETYEEEIFEEYEDFDEDKYNEYMDTYEDQYDK
jgi:DNA-directed RNA polymerase subunit delta